MNARLSNPLPNFKFAIKNLVVLLKKNLITGRTLTCQNQNFVRCVTGHTPLTKKLIELAQYHIFLFRKKKFFPLNSLFMACMKAYYLE